MYQFKNIKIFIKCSCLHIFKYSVNLLDPQNLRCDRMLKHSFLKLSKLQNIILILICNLEYFCHGFSQIYTMVFALSNLDEYCHDFIQLIQGNNLVSISIKKVEDANQVFICAAR